MPAEFCDIDHVEEWAADSGRTDQDNAPRLCGLHDRWKHERRLRGRRDDPEWPDAHAPPPPVPPTRTVTCAEWTRGRSTDRCTPPSDAIVRVYSATVG